MLSTVVTALLLGIVLLIVASLFMSVWFVQRRHKKLLAAQTQGATHPLDSHVTAILHFEDGVVVGVEKPESLAQFNLPSSWYTRRRTLVSLAFLVMILLTLFTQGGLAGGTLRSLGKSLNLSFLNANQSQSTDVRTVAHSMPETASTRLIRIDSALRNQYYTDYQLSVWSYSSCSGIAMEMVMNAYGRHFIAADILQEELKLGVWSVQLGLLREEGITMTANYFGFDASLSHARTLQDIINISNKGAPVIVSVRDSYYFPGGHIFVVHGGDSQYVYIADSSPANFKRMPYSMFQGMWIGFSAVLTPR